MCFKRFCFIIINFQILQARLQQYVNQELPDVQAGFRKGRGTTLKLTIFAGSWRQQENPEKHLFLLH